MADTARHPSRRTVVKAGLWAAPAVAVVNLTSMSAAHASGCLTTYVSHGFAVFLVETAGVPTYYSFKFGDVETGETSPGDDGNPSDQDYLANKYPTATIIYKDNEASGAQVAVRASLLASLKTSLYSDASGVGYQITAAAPSLAGVYAFDGSFKDNKYKIHPITSPDGQFRLSKGC